MIDRRTASGPLRLRPILKHRVWGGRKLERFGLELPPEGAVGEAWVLADLPESVPEGRTPIVGGAFDGLTLREAIAANPAAILGATPPTSGGDFPLLLKLLDARENLSVQVHPTPRFVDANPGCHVKSEAWIILAAEPGAVIYKGLRPDCRATADTTAFRERVESGAIVEDLHAIEVRPGECHYLPSGTCHALGAGILVAEVQTPSDTTFRVFDWGRTGRELHLDAAVECIFDRGEAASSPAVPAAAAPKKRRGKGEGVPTAPSPAAREQGPLRSALLCESADFTITRLSASADRAVQGPVGRREGATALFVIAGAIDFDDGVGPILAGRAAAIPAAAAPLAATFSPGAAALVIDLPALRHLR
ncbi:MAG TPA: class I mannose-6-phosphate isomerase [Phycisphaerales bacterium]|nr:class I mannose-6-phosphate isomerase [Phycisphaerales bacterium]HMP37295.1 class I mannose-6-phosphate isomerase [Phycisphaerales bacterium]